MKNTYLKIFLIFLIIFSFQVQWNDSWDFDAKLAQTINIVEHNQFNIDEFKDWTPITFFEKGHIYPTTSIYKRDSILATFPYTISYITYSLFPKKIFPEKKEIICHKKGRKISLILGQKISYSRFIVTLLLPVLFGALLMCSLYKIFDFFLESKRKKRILIISFGLGTSIFPYSTAFYSYIPSLFLVVTSFYLIIKTTNVSKHRKKKYLLLAGLLSGFGSFLYMFAFIPVFFLLLYVIRKNKTISLPLIFLLGTSLGFLPSIIYNYSVHGFIFRRMEEITSIGYIRMVDMPTAINNVFYYPEIVTRILYYPYRGLFFYYPFLLFFFPGIYFMYRNGEKYESILSFVFFMLYLSWVASFTQWWGNYAFGPRRMVLLLPILILPILNFLKYNNSKGLERIFLLFVIFSIIINLMGLQVWEGKVQINDVNKKMGTWEPLGNPVVNRYIPLTLKRGPRSVLLENLILHNKLSILNAPQPPQDYKIVDEK